MADEEFELVLINAVPYLLPLQWIDVLTGHVAASGGLRRPVRNHVWDNLLRLLALQKEFIRRYKQNAPVDVLNCCTAKMKAAKKRAVRDALMNG